MSSIKLSELLLLKMAAENHWDNDRHTLYILGEFLKHSVFSGEQFALRRAIKIIKQRKQS